MFRFPVIFKDYEITLARNQLAQKKKKKKKVIKPSLQCLQKALKE